MVSPKEKIKTIAHAPGVYLYRDRADVIIYIGKAKDLRKRVGQYWSRDAAGPKTQRLVSQIARIETVETASEFDALLLEAALIRKHSPKYNVVLKDDKSPLYILLTLSEKLPRVKLLRRSDLPKKIPAKDVLFGPFQSAAVVRSLMRQLRRITPYCTQKRRTGKPCFYYHLGLCDPCPSDAKTNPGDYRKNILRIKRILSGRAADVIHDLEKDMKAAARRRAFEEAARLRNHTQNLYRLLSKRYDPMLYIQSDAAAMDIYRNELEDLSRALGIPRLSRIECFDISNTGGAQATGSMVVLTDGKKDTAEYKRFRIRMHRPAGKPNDVAMIAEVIGRRMTHPEWGTADLIVVDGGKPQVAAAKPFAGSIPVVGIAKRLEELIVPLPDGRWKILRLGLTSPGLHVVERIRDEAHRFALSYHRLLRKKAFNRLTASCAFGTIKRT